MSESIRSKLGNAAKKGMRQVSPGVYVPEDASMDVPEVAICAFVRNRDNTYKLEVVAERLVRLTDDVIRALGLVGQRATLRRLARAGFVEIVQVAPKVRLLNLDSYFNHLRRVTEDEDFWDRDGGNFKLYQENLH